MLFIANLQTRTVMTYPQGDIVFFSSAEQARMYALGAEARTGQPHAIQDAETAPPAWRDLPRAVGPWY